MSPHLIAILGTVVALQSTSTSKQTAALATQRDPTRLEAAAVAVASSNDAGAIGKLAAQLGTRSFLRRLDPPGKGRAKAADTASDGSGGMDWLEHVFHALGEHPSAATEALCVGLAHDKEFVSVPARLNLLLNSLAAVQPTSQEAAAIFQETSHSGFLAVNGPLLARKADPPALAVLEQLMTDESLDAQERVDVAHRSFLPFRTNPAVVAMAARASSSATTALPVRTAIIESLFDYQPKPWFGVAMNQPVPPPWSTAIEATRKALRALGEQLLGRTDVAPTLRTAIQNTLAQFR